jgi:hypothetical protein
MPAVTCKLESYRKEWAYLVNNNKVFIMIVIPFSSYLNCSGSMC